MIGRELRIPWADSTILAGFQEDSLFEQLIMDSLSGTVAARHKEIADHVVQVIQEMQNEKFF
jgi:hypothetical protein